jgi:glycosyltransferase involved in cell wall biosynthesis
MAHNPTSTNIAILGSYVPRRCGIATFTKDLHDALRAIRPEWEFPVLAVTDNGSAIPYPQEVRFEIGSEDGDAYNRAADFLDLSRADVLNIQHEFGIYGGPGGALAGGLLEDVRIPVVTTLHTVLEKFDEEQAPAFHAIARNSTRLVVMSARGAEILRGIHRVPDWKISVIPHGIPDLAFVDPNFYKEQFDVAGRPVLLTFGLLTRGKGLEIAIKALPEIVRNHPRVVYIILGATHPHLLAKEGEAYRDSLQTLAADLGVSANVMFINRYVGQRELCEFIGAADFYITPYHNESQITSGTLSYSVGAGKAVVSTPYWHASELLAEGRGMLVPFRDPQSIAEVVGEALLDPAKRHAMRRRAYLAGRSMVWPQVARAYATVFEQARRDFQQVRKNGSAARRVRPDMANLPPVNLRHLASMADGTGILTHAVHTVPVLEGGYRTTVNARTLLLSAMAADGAEDSARDLAHLAAAFVEAAFVPKACGFRQTLAFNRRWIDEGFDEVCHATVLWALGAVVARIPDAGLRAWASSLFERALPAASEFTSPDAQALVLLGVQEYFRVLHGDLLANRLRGELAAKLLSHAATCRAEGAQTDARISRALILAGRWMNDESLLREGLDALRRLMEDLSPGGGFFHATNPSSSLTERNGDGFPEEHPRIAEHATGACIEAFHATSHQTWAAGAWKAFDWFLGGNAMGARLADPVNGSCCDGLHHGRVNLNRGADAILSFQTALAEIHSLAGTPPSPPSQ